MAPPMRMTQPVGVIKELRNYRYTLQNSVIIPKWPNESPGVKKWRETVTVTNKSEVGTRSITAAIKDPQGARRAIWEYGKLTNWPDLSLSGLILKGGEKGWIPALRDAQPLALGTAWDIIEGYEQNEEKKRTTKTPTYNAAHQTEKDNEPMPVLQWTESTGVDAGDYSAVITDIEDEDGQFGPQVRLQFVILDDDGDQTKDQIRGWASQKWGPKTKLYDWARAVLGKKCPGPGQPFDTDKLINRKCDIRVEEKAGPQGPRSFIAGVFPFGTINRPEVDDDEPVPVKKAAKPTPVVESGDDIPF